MNTRLTAVLVVVLVLLGGVYWYTDLRNPVTPTPVGGPQPTVIDISADDVARVDVNDAGKSAAVARGDDGNWKLVAPENADADQSRVDGVISRLAKLNATRKIDDATDLASYGLDKPSSSVRLTTKSGTTYQLQIGAKTPDGSAYYAKLGDQPAVYVISSFTLGDALEFATDPPKPKPSPTALPLLTPTP